MKILVVEDDQTVAQTLQRLFTDYNYAVDIAADGDAGLQMADAFEYDLILLDVMLPKLDGVSLCQQLRAKGFRRSILLLTGQAERRQKVIALKAGADDYVVEPFDPEELMARVQALFRRGSPTNQPILTWGYLSVDPSSCKVAYGTHLISLTPKEYAILELFLRNPERALSSNVILDRVWTSLECPGEEAVRVHIKELRQKLAAVGAPKDFIKTKHRAGYLLNPLYSFTLVPQTATQLTRTQIAEVNTVNAELRAKLELLQLTQAELQQKYQELKIAYQTLQQERQRFQASRDELERQVANREANLQQRQDLLKQLQAECRRTKTAIEKSLALRKNAQLLRRTTADIRVGSWDWELTTGQLTWSSETYRLYGLDPADGLPQYKDWYDKVLYPDDRTRVKDYIAKALEQRLSSIQLEFRILHPQHGIRWLLILGRLTLDEQGNPIRLSGINLDITGRKLTLLNK